MHSKTGSTNSFLRVANKRGIQVALGFLWLLDGALQLQPRMFTSAFANRVIAPAAVGQPGVVSGPMSLAIHILLMHPAFFDACFGLIQLALGVLILWQRSLKVGLLGSAVWGLVVWYMGEGLGGLLSGQTSLLMGAPGAALIYVILALAVMPAPSDTKSKGIQQPAYWLPIIWMILWIGGAVYQLLPAQNTTAGLSSMISGMGQGAPGWMAALDTHIGNLLHGQGWWVIGLLAAVQALIGLLILIPGRIRTIAISAGVILSLIFWVVGQSLGQYYTGLATDPNAAPLFILLGVAITGCTQLDGRQLWWQLTHDLNDRLI